MLTQGRAMKALEARIQELKGGEKLTEQQIINFIISQAETARDIFIEIVKTPRMVGHNTLDKALAETGLQAEPGATKEDKAAILFTHLVQELTEEKKREEMIEAIKELDPVLNLQEDMSYEELKDLYETIKEVQGKLSANGGRPEAETKTMEDENMKNQNQQAPATPQVDIEAIIAKAVAKATQDVSSKYESRLAELEKALDESNKALQQATTKPVAEKKKEKPAKKAPEKKEEKPAVNEVEVAKDRMSYKELQTKNDELQKQILEAIRAKKESKTRELQAEQRKIKKTMRDLRNKHAEFGTVDKLLSFTSSTLYASADIVDEYGHQGVDFISDVLHGGVNVVSGTLRTVGEFADPTLNKKK